MKEYTKKQRITAYAILALIIIVQIIYTTFTFVYKKEGYHSDEVWSYGLANSYYKPFIHMKSGIANSIVTHEAYTEEAYDNNNKWISGKVFKDYLTVQQDERFSYGSVIYNQTLDNHPPLYYCLIHTISSLFPDRFSFIYGYILNCIFLIVTQIFLYKLCLLVLKNKNIYIPLVVCGLYAFGIGSVSTFIFIRIYAMLAMLITMHMYFQLKYIEYPDKSLKKLLPPVLITAFVGFMTEYLFIAAAGICTACICLIMLFRKQIKKMFIWGLSMLATLIVFFTLYSSALNQIGGYELTTSFTPYEQFRRLLSYCTYSTLGLGISVMRSSWYAYVITALVIISIICIPLAFLFRKETWFIKFLSYFKSKLKKIPGIFRKFNLHLLVLAITALAHIVTVSFVTNTIMNGNWVMRYVMPILPIVTLCAFSLIFYLVSWIVKNEKFYIPILTAVSIIMLCRMHIVYKNYFLFEQPEDSQSLSETISGEKCIFVFNGDLWLMTCIAPEAIDAESCYVTTEYDVKNNDSLDDVFELEENEKIYLVIPKLSEDDDDDEDDTEYGIYVNVPLKSSTLISSNEILKKINSLEGVSNIGYLYSINVQGATYGVYEIS